MYKIYTFISLILSSLSFGQVLYEDFNYTTPGNIGGTNSTADGTNNNWTTYSNTQAGTIDLVNGSLSYNGLLASSGNMVQLPGNNTTTPRDIYRSLPSLVTGPTTMYYSALINVLDDTQLATNGAPIGANSHFMCFSSVLNPTSTVSGIFNGRIAATKPSPASTTYKLYIQNNSIGGSSNFTEFPQDLNFGTTYLVVVKLVTNGSSASTAFLWVNPSTLGGAEPAGSVSNSSGTSTAADIGSILLRNSSQTAKVQVDEIRVGSTFADVTPVALSSASFNQISGLKLYPNPAKNILNIETALNKNLDVSIFDLTGKKVLETTTTSKSVNLETIQSGVYNVKVIEEGKVSIQKLIIE